MKDQEIDRLSSELQASRKAYSEAQDNAAATLRLDS